MAECRDRAFGLLQSLEMGIIESMAAFRTYRMTSLVDGFEARHSQLRAHFANRYSKAASSSQPQNSYPWFENVQRSLVCSINQLMIELEAIIQGDPCDQCQTYSFLCMQCFCFRSNNVIWSIFGFIHPKTTPEEIDNQSISLLLALAVLKILQRIRVVFAHSARPGI